MALVPRQKLVVYDSLGLPLNVRITTVLEEKNSSSTVYRWYATSGEERTTRTGPNHRGWGTGRLEFDSNGDLITTTQSRVSVQRNTTASESPLEITLDFSQVKALGENRCPRKIRLAR